MTPPPNPTTSPMSAASPESCGPEVCPQTAPVATAEGGATAGPRQVLRRWAKLAVFLLCAGIILSLSVSGERMADSLHLIKAEKMAKSERWDEAYRSYQKLVPKHQDDTNVVLSYAEAAVRTGHHEDATRALLVLNGRPRTDRQMRRMSLVFTALERAGHKPAVNPAPVPLTMY